MVTEIQANNMKRMIRILEVEIEVAKEDIKSLVEIIQSCYEVPMEVQSVTKEEYELALKLKEKYVGIKSGTHREN